MRTPAAITALVAVLAAGCVAGPRATAPHTESSGPAETVTTPSTATGSLGVAATLPPTAPATPSPTAATSSTPGRGDLPPEMFALLPDGSGVAALLGSHCWDLGCVDGPPPSIGRLPLVNLPAAGGVVSVAIDGPVGFVQWSASYLDETAEGGVVTLRGGGDAPDPDVRPAPGSTPAAALSEASFAGPPSGDWTVTVFVMFDGGGDAAYHWHVRSP